MRFSSGVLAVVATVLSLGSGCVSTGTYQAKEQESAQLSKNLEESKGIISEISEKNRKLLKESETLAASLKVLEEELTRLKEESVRLKDDNGKLIEESGRLREENAKLSEAAKPENLLKSLANSLATLLNENSRLKLALEDAEKSSKMNSDPIKISPEIAKPVPVDLKKVEVNSAPSEKEETLKAPPVMEDKQLTEPVPQPR